MPALPVTNLFHRSNADPKAFLASDWNFYEERDKVLLTILIEKLLYRSQRVDYIDRTTF